MLKKVFFTLALALLAFSLFAQNVPLSFDVEDRGADCNMSAGSLSNNPNLPDPFGFNDGSRVSTFDDWTCRRDEIKADMETYELGVKPLRPSDISASYSGGTLTVTVRENGRTLTIRSTFSIPSGAGPHAIVIGMDGATGSLSSSLFSGIVQVPFTSSQLATGTHNGTKNLNDPFYSFYPNLSSAGKYLAWSWGVSRLIDGLEIIADQYNLDMSRIAVTGCSYAGKMALFSGAFDDRIALTIAQESGGGGINSWRTSQDFTNRTGTNVEKINNTNSSWFLQGLTGRDPYSLPHDHHELIAMIAPRAFLTLGNATYGDWLGDESGWKSCMAALEVWKAMGVEDRFGFDFTGGHEHCQAATSQNNSVKAFVDKYLRNISSANTSIRINPSRSDFDYNWQSSVNWTTPEISFNPNVPRVTIVSPVENSILLGEEVDILAEVEDLNNDVTKVEYFIGETKIGEDASAPYSVSWMGENTGSVSLTVRATDSEGNTGEAKLTITVRVPQAPFGGTAHAIPGTIQLEEFDVGGNGFAYSDDTPGSETGVNYRSDEDVDIEECTDAGGGYNLGWTTAGEWLEYTVDVETTGFYDVGFRVACNGDDRTISLSMDGANLVTDVAVPNTAGWQQWQTITSNDIMLTEGSHILRLTVGATDYINLNFVTFALTQEIKQEPYNGTAASVPGRIELEDYDLGGEGLAFHEANANGNQGDGDYRNDEVDIEICTDTDGGYNIGYALAGEWLEYTLDVQQAGTYDLELRVACNGTGRSISLTMDGAELAEDVAIPNTSGWQNWQTITVSDLYLEAGEQILRLTIGATDYVNLNYIEFKLNTITSLGLEEEMGINLAPNPFNTELNIRITDGEVDYVIYDLYGKALEQGHAGNNIKIGRQLTSGVYILELRNGNKVSSQRIVKR